MLSLSEGLRGLLRTLLCCFFAVAPVGMVSGWAALLWVVWGGVRAWKGDEGVSTDCKALFVLGMMLGRKELWGLTKETILAFGNMGVAGLSVGTVALGIAISVAVLGGTFWRRTQGREHAIFARPSYGMPSDLKNYDVEHPGPMIFPCRTTHARVFPKRHAFGYSYLLYGIPITPAEVAADGSGFRYGDDRKSGNWWMQIRAEDHLFRGHGDIGLYNKLKTTLKDQGVQDMEWSYAYLVTAPRFFGYSFNPVSFWYIYNRSHELKYMILEVNNTFGERRIYLLDGSSLPTPPQTTDSEFAALGPKVRKFTDHWEKDFHVSPFNSRKGSYALKALDPFPAPDFAQPKLDNTITLKSSKDHAKIVARVYSTGPALDALNLGLWATIRFIGGWWWVGFVTFPRILKEAFKLFFQRSLHVWFRPEVLSSSIARAPTTTEIIMQEFFHAYLQHLVTHSPHQWNITYHTAIPARPTIYVASVHIPGRPICPRKLEIRILSPVFYTRFVHYAHTSEAFDRECLFTDERNRTVWISDPELLHLLLSKYPDPRSVEQVEGKMERSRIEEWRWWMLRKLRCPPPEPAYAATNASSRFDLQDIRTLPFSDLDVWARGRNRCNVAGLYRRNLARIFFAERLAFGFTEGVDLVDLILRVCLCLLAVKALTDRKKTDMSPGNWWGVIDMGMRICACHFYGLLKGYT